MTATSSQTINFSSDADGDSIRLELDSDYIISVYGEEITKFKKTQMVYLKVTPAYSDTPYTLFSSNGDLTIASHDELEEVTEQLTFANEKSAKLSDLPVDSLEMEWIAGPDVSVLVSDKVISTPNKTVGILECTYYKKFDRLKLRVDEDMDDDVVLVVVENASDTASEEVDYIGDDDLLRDITLVIKDIVSDEVIPFAEVRVTLEGQTIFSGTANENGKVTIQDMIEGQTYDLFVTAEDYLDSDSDYLNNDSFTVPSSTEGD